MINLIKSKKRTTKTIVLTSILLVSVLFANFEQENNKNTPLFVSALTPHAPIIITDDSGLSAFPGTGTSGDPYVIEGYSIITNELLGIYITGTSKHFVIKNCYVDAGIYGLLIDDVGVATAIITNNTVTNNDYGILLVGSDSNSVYKNTCTNNVNYGILLDSSDSNWVSENTCTNNVNYGIFLVGSDSNWVSENTCTNNGAGIYLAGPSNGNWVIANNCSYNSIGIHLQYSYDNSVSANNCTNNSDTGIYLYSSTTNSVNENNCTNNDYGISLDGSSNDNSVSANNCSYNVNNGITLAGSSNGISVSANNCSYNEYGIYLYQSNYTNINENSIQYNDDYGILITMLSFYNFIYENSFDTNNLGGTSQALDDGADNQWFNPFSSQGNYWSDWTGGPYSIDGSAGSADLYPVEYPQTPPTITAVSHDPSSPTELDTITISATVTDLTGINAVELAYRINSGSWIYIAMTLSTGSLYQVTIGPFSVGFVIEYFIYAEDNASNYNEAIEDNNGAYYSFTVSVAITEFSSLSPLLLLSLSLLLLVTVPILYKRKRT